MSCIHVATPEDIPTLMQLDLESYIYSWPLEVWVRGFEHLQFRILFNDDETPVGYWVGADSYEDSTRFRIYRLGVRKFFQGQGYSIPLMKDLIAYADSQKFTHTDFVLSGEYCGNYDELDLRYWLEM